MRCQNRSALFNRGDKPVTWLSCFNCCYQHTDCIIPYNRRNFVIDPGIGDDLHIAFSYGGENEHARAMFSLIDSLGEELPHRFGVGTIVLGPTRHDVEPYFLI